MHGGHSGLPYKSLQLAAVEGPSVTYEGDLVAPPAADSKPMVDISMLSSDQLRAYRKITEHESQTRAGKKIPQLLMQIQGEGGTGKSLVISKVTEYFKAIQRGASLRRAAYTGIAASQIEGSTLHQLALLHLWSETKSLSNKSVKRLHATWGPVEYLIIDEISMVSKKTFAALSEMVAIGKQVPRVNNSTIPFGGVNVIIAGDFHQFPPVVGEGKGRGALYSPTAEKHSLKPAGLGERLYRDFTTVVILRNNTGFKIKSGRQYCTELGTGNAPKRIWQ